MGSAAGPVGVHTPGLWAPPPAGGPGCPVGPAPRSLPVRYGPAADRVRRRSSRRPLARKTPSRTMTDQDPSHPALALNDTVHQRVRLALITLLSAAQVCR